MAILIFVACCIGRVFFSLARSALVNMRRPRLLELEQKGSANARSIKRLTEHSGRLLATAEVGALLTLVAASGIAALHFVPAAQAWVAPWASAWMSERSMAALAYVVVMLAAAMVLFVIGRLVPEAIAMRYTEPLALALVGPMEVFGMLLSPLVRLAVWLSNLLSIPFGGQKRESTTLVTEAEIKTMVDAGEEEGLIEEDEKEMILSVLDFGDTVVREVMVPRMDIAALDAETPFDVALAEMVKAGHSRVPIYRESIDDIIGVLYAKDMLRAIADGKRMPLADLVRPAAFTPESKRVSELLQDLQKSRVHLCVVVDEYGGTAGLVTIEDILEEIVGEIQDEYDTEEPDVVPLDGGAGYTLDAGMNLDDVNELLHATLLNATGDTLGGFIFDQLGKVPVAGDIVRHSGLIFEVLSVRERRILKVQVTYANQEKEKGAATGGEEHS